MNYFYIITRDNSIYEIPYSEENYTKTLTQWQQGGLLFVKSKNTSAPVGVNSVDIKTILGEDDYDGWTRTADVKQYVRNGTWYDTRERKFLRNEKWKQEEVDRMNKIGSSSTGSKMSSNDIARAKAKKTEISSWAEKKFPSKLSTGKS